MFRKRSALPALVLSAGFFLQGCGGGGGGGSASTTQLPASAAPTPAPTPTSAPTLGENVDTATTQFMADRGITALTVTIMLNGNVLYEKGYGFKDVAGTIPLPADALMLTASVVKPITAAAIHKLAGGGMISLTDHVFCTGSNAPCRLPQSLLPASYDPRIGDITIRHLLEHSGGWDRNISGEPQGQEADVQNAFGLSTPPTKDDDIRYWLAKPLDFAPGTGFGYSNFGFMVLGRVIEEVTGTSYVQYVQTSIMAPMGIASADFDAAASLLQDRSPREPNYITSVTGPSVYFPGQTVLAIDGALNMQNWAPAGTSITTSRALATFAGKYRLPPELTGLDVMSSGQDLAGGTSSGFKDGAFTGSSAIVRQRSSGISYAALMNFNGPDIYGIEFKEVIDAVLQQSGL